MTPFHVAVPRGELDELHRRLDATRWPDDATDASQGPPLAQVRALCDTWRAHDWRATEARLNELPQVRVTIDGLLVHAVHLRSPDPDAVPVVLTHGWPGSFLEFEAAARLLAADGFHVVVPSLPGYGFSGKPSDAGWGIHRIAQAWCGLMSALGHERFVAAGSDWGTSVSTSIALQRPERLLGLHLVPPLVGPAEGPPSEAERAAADELAQRERTGSAYLALHATRPQTVGYGLVDSPAGLAAWLGEKLVSWADPRAPLTPEQIVENLSLYWFTRSAASSARLYWESIAEVSSWFTAGTTDAVHVPTGATVFPAEVPRPSRRAAEVRFRNLVHWGEPELGGHFGAWEQPEVFASEVRAAVDAVQAGVNS